ncbi:MAG: sulfatase-like hydrolase/transferase [Roseibacillus sp.]|nr:sulfatase-like hydrolase/transferase [Roseibacillus sp.]
MKLPIILLTLALVTLLPLRGAPPNLIIIFADDLGYGELSCQNPRTDVPTPHIDSIAKNGVRCTQAYVTAPNCSPSRAGLLTGRIPTRFGYENNPTGWKNESAEFGLPLQEITLAELLQGHGYTTGLIGKWHLGGTAKFHPHRHGFDNFFGFTHEGHSFVPPPYRGVTTMLRRKALPGNKRGRWTSADRSMVYTTHMGSNEPDYNADNPIVRGGQPVQENAYLTDALTREAVSFLKRNHDRPSFLFLAYNAVHSPLQGADAYMKKFAHLPDIHRRIFAAMLANLDDGVGEILKTVRALKQEENTLIVFLSDNGGPTRELTSSNLPLRGGKGQMYEGGLRIPFMVQWKGHLPAGQLYRHPVSSMDLFATAAGLGNIPAPENLDGVDLLPYLRGSKKDPPHESLFWRQRHKTAFRMGAWKIVGDTRKQDDHHWELYNLAQDLTERVNLASRHPDKLNELRQAWSAMNAQMAEPLF